MVVDSAEYRYLLVDAPAEHVRRITLNRPEKRNALNNGMRGELLAALQAHDRDAQVRVSIVRGAGKCFCSGYDLSSDLGGDQPYFTAGGDGDWSRHVSAGWFSIWDLAKPVLAEVHGHALAGGSELAAACDLLYVAEDAQIGYPVVRVLSPPDWQFHPWLMQPRAAMEMMLSGDAIDGVEAVRVGLANRAWPAAELSERVVERAVRVAGIAPELSQLNKRAVIRALEMMGARTAMRAGSELMALATHLASTRALSGDALGSVKAALSSAAAPSVDVALPPDVGEDSG